MAKPTAVLVTRSGDGGQVLAGRVAAHGLDPIVYAPVEPGPLPRRDGVARQVRECLPVDVLIAPSAEALRQLAELFEPAVFAQALIVVPGAGTAAVAARLGFAPVSYPDAEGSSERILELPELQDVRGARILIAAAEGGRTLIAGRLAERGAVVHRLAVYQRRPVAPSESVLERIVSSDGMVTLLASGGALAELERQLPHACWRLLAGQLVIAPSERVAGMARALGCGQVVVAAAADDDAMLAALFEHCPPWPPIRYPVGGKS